MERQVAEETWWYAVIDSKVYPRSFSTEEDWCKELASICWNKTWDELESDHNAYVRSVKLEV